MPQFIWQNNYTWEDLCFRRWRLFIYRLAAWVSLCLALLFLAVFLISLWEYTGSFSLTGLLPPAPGAKAFWLSLLLGGYTWYRLERERYWYPPLPRNQDQVIVDKHLASDVWAVLEQAFRYARRVAHSQVTPLHLMAGALRDRTAVRVLVRLGIDINKLAVTLRHALVNEEQGWPARLSKDSQTAFKQAAVLAWQRKANHIEVTELLLALTQIESNLKDVIEEMDISPAAVANVTAWFTLRRNIASQRQQLLRRAQFHPKYALDRAYVAVEAPFLNRVAHNLTAAAARGYLMPCLGRDSEFEQIFHLFAGGQAGVVLVGEAGVGKNSIIEGLAQLMSAEDVPAVIKDKRLYALSLPQLLSGMTAAAASGRLWRALTEAMRAGNIVLGINNIEQLASSDGSAEQLSLSDILANVMSEHGLLIVATTTPAAWRNLEKTSSLAQVLQPVVVNELDDDSAIQVLELHLPRLEYEQRIFFSYSALQSVVSLARRYLPERYLPGKAITLLDELAVYGRDHKGRGAVVTKEDAAQLIAGKVHVPLAQVTSDETKKLLNLEQILHQRIVGQDEAVKLVAEALRRARVNLRDQKRPIASFLFLGPTGVGKTELAKVVAGEYFGGEDKMIRLDMSEYQTAESLHRLVGAPYPGGERGLLTDSVRYNPYCLLLLDEIEKAHPSILNVFLQVFDDARATDASGRTVDFTNTIIIATSNAGTQFIQESLLNNVPMEYIRRTLIHSGLKQYFHPEFLNRLDAIVVFKPLSREEIEKIAALLLTKLADDLAGRGIHLKASPAAIKELAQKGFDPLYGARPLRRVIQDSIDSALAHYLLTGKLGRRDLVILEPGGEIRVAKASKL